MARRNRETLKNYFKQGRRPGEQEFEDLIDSTLNTLDDGFLGSPQIGIGLAPLSEKGVLLSTYRNPGDSKPVWEIAIDKTNADLQIRRYNENSTDSILTIKHNSELAVGENEIVFDGILNSKGRKGSFKTGYVPADGKWHDIISKDDRLESGCWAFEVVAGCGERNKGKYSLVVATAMHCFSSKPRIHMVRSFFGIWGNKIKLRWVKYKGEYEAKLQIRTRFKYSEEVFIQYQIANLWDNPKMQPPLDVYTKKR